MTSPLGIAVVGAGYWGQNLIRNLLASEHTWLHAVCDLDVDRARQPRWPSIRATDQLDEILDDERVEAVAVAVPVAAHFDVALACLAAGKHVLIEKPLAATLAEAEKLVAFADERELTLMLDHTYCFTPAVACIRDTIAAGTLGAIQYVDSVRINLGLVQPDVDVFWDLLPHDVSILDSVLPGGFHPVAVSAVGVDPIGAGRACVGYVTMLLPGDAIAHVHLSWLSPVKIRTVVFGGSRRHLVWDDVRPAQRVSIYERGVDIDPHERLVQYRTGDMHAPALVEGEALQGVVAEFARAVRAHDAPLTDGHAGVRVMEVLEAVRSSLAANGTPIVFGLESHAGTERQSPGVDGRVEAWQGPAWNLGQ